MENYNGQIIETLVQAGDAILEVYNSNEFSTELKSDNSPVTNADKASALIINQMLKSLFPDIPVINEENSVPPYNVRKSWDRCFLVDPLDGTKEFLQKNNEFCVNLAFVKKGKPIAGWIYVPVQGKGYCCFKGKGVFGFDRNGNLQKTEHSRIFPEKLRITISRSFSNTNELDIISKTEIFYPVEVVQLGSSLKHIAILKNEADMYLKAGACYEWDTAPGQLMVEEMGGAVIKLSNFTRLTYNKRNLQNPQFVMLSPALNNPDFLDVLNRVIDNLALK